jgi:hypothetical protein
VRGGEDGGRGARAGRAAAAAALIATAGGAVGCSSDVLDVDVALAPQTYGADFGAAAGEIPAVACEPQVADSCGGPGPLEVAASAGEAQLSTGCDPGTARCYVQADVRVARSVAVLQEDGFVAQVKRESLAFVRIVDLAYTVPTNSLTFDLPEVTVYVGPEGTTRETDPGVHPIAAMPALAAGATVIDPPGHLTLADESPAHDFIEWSVRERLPFVFVMSFAPRLDSGAPIPAGAVEIVLAPMLRIGLPR